MTAGDFPATQDAAIRRELQRILSSDTFGASSRNRQFLSYVVEETLAGRRNRIKAYSIATQVFGRGDDFDPLQDSIVRIEAGRLRRELEHFYLKEGRAEGVAIEIPKGTYVPTFDCPELGEDSDPGTAGAAERPKTVHYLGPRVIVHKFDEFGNPDVLHDIGRKLTWQVISALTRYTELFVYGYETADYLAREGRAEQATRLEADYELFGTATVTATTLRVELLFRRVQDNRFVWAHDFENPLANDSTPADLVELCHRIAGQIVRKIADRDGIMDSQAREADGDAPNSFRSYQKLLDFHEYWRSLDPRLYEPLRRDLESAVARDPTFAAGLACLSMLYSNAVRYAYNVSSICRDPLERAMELAERAIRLAPNSSRAYHARAIVEWFSGDPDQSLETLRIARSLNPNDSEIMGELGFRYAMRAKWHLAVPLIEESYLRNPMQASTYHMGLFLYHFAEGRYEEALRQCALIRAPSVANVRIAAAAALSRLGQPQKSRLELCEAEKIDPTLPGRLEADLTMRNVHPDLICELVDALGTVDPRWNGPRPPVELKI